MQSVKRRQQTQAKGAGEKNRVKLKGQKYTKGRCAVDKQHVRNT